MMTRHFVDGVGNVFVLGGVARLEFFELIPQESGANTRPDLQRSQTLTIAMPLESFFSAVELLEKIRNEIKEAADSNQSNPVSPNFRMDS